MTSAVNPWDTESQPSVTHCPSRHICLILFGRIVPPLALFIDPTIGSGSFKLKPPPEARAAPTQLHASGLVARCDVNFLQRPPARLDAADIRRDLSHELSNGWPPRH